MHSLLQKGIVRPSLFRCHGGPALLRTMHKILHEHYDVESTTVSHIPMKVSP